jgi:hypothetical protein
MRNSKKYPEAQVDYIQKIENRFKTDNPDLQKFVVEVRLKSTVIMLEYMVVSSSFALLVSIVKFLTSTLSMPFRYLVLLVRGVDGATATIVEKLSGALLQLLNSDRKSAQFTMEECALRLT